MELKEVLDSVFKTKEDLTTEIDGARELVDAPSMWVINRIVSMTPEYVFDCNDINIYPVDATMAFDFLRFRLPKLKRVPFNQWIKPEPVSEDVELLKRYYECSTAKALDAFRVLTPEQMEIIRHSFDEGGVEKKEKKKAKK